MSIHNHKSIIPRWFIYTLIATLVITGIVVTGLIYRSVQAMLSTPLNPVEVADLPPVDVQPSPIPGQSLPPVMIVSSTTPAAPSQPTPTLFAPEVVVEDEDRITVLVMGIDRRPSQRSFLARTDTLLLLSIDQAEQSASMLSIPRDLYVNIPGHGVDRINTAFQTGMIGGEPAQGALTAMQTIEENLGVHVDHYLLIDFLTVINVIDNLGGVTVQVPFTIYDPTYPDMDYGFDPFYIEAGWQTLDGETALKYMRTRHADNDFGRASRQQQVILAFRNQVLGLGAGELITRIPFFYAQFSGGVFTDLSPEDLIAIAQAAQDISGENIQTAVLNYDYVRDYISPSGGSVLLLREDKVAALIANLFR